MQSKRFVFLIGAVVLVASALVWQASRETSSMVFRVPQISQHQGDMLRVRVGGRVAPLPIEYNVEPQLRLAFTIEDMKSDAARIPVVYEGLKPDMFAPGRDVIIDGDFKGGVLYASKLLTQCPSKYEPPKVTEGK